MKIMSLVREMYPRESNIFNIIFTSYLNLNISKTNMLTYSKFVIIISFRKEQNDVTQIWNSYK